VLMYLAITNERGQKANKNEATKASMEQAIETESETDDNERDHSPISKQNSICSGDEMGRPMNGLNDPYDTSGDTETVAGVDLLFEKRVDGGEHVMEKEPDMKEKEDDIPVGNKDLQNTLAEKRRELDEKQSSKISTKLDDIKAMALQGEWSSKIFHLYKYVTEAMLEDEGEGSIMKEAQKRKAMKSLILSRVGNMRDYFV